MPIENIIARAIAPAAWEHEGTHRLEPRENRAASLRQAHAAVDALASQGYTIIKKGDENAHTKPNRPSPRGRRPTLELGDQAVGPDAGRTTLGKVLRSVGEGAPQ